MTTILGGLVGAMLFSLNPAGISGGYALGAAIARRALLDSRRPHRVQA